MPDKVKILYIILTNEQRSGYCAGETVSGHVLVEVSALTNIKGIKLNVKGLAQVCWNNGPQRESLRSPAGTALSQTVKEENECLSISQTICEPTGKFHNYLQGVLSELSILSISTLALSETH